MKSYRERVRELREAARELYKGVNALYEEMSFHSSGCVSIAEAQASSEKASCMDYEDAVAPAPPAAREPAASVRRASKTLLNANEFKLIPGAGTVLQQMQNYEWDEKAERKYGKARRLGRPSRSPRKPKR